MGLHLAGAQKAVQSAHHVDAHSIATPASPTTITADFSSHEKHPLVKDKFGVYQTPFMGINGRPSLTAMKPFLARQVYAISVTNSLGESPTPSPTVR